MNAPLHHTAMGKLTRDDMLSCSQLPVLVLGRVYNRTPNDVLRSCLDAIDGKPREQLDPNESMFWGSTLERTVLQVAASRMMLELETGFTTPFQHPTLPLQCSMDGMADGKGELFENNPSLGIYVLTESGSITLEGKGCIEAKVTKDRPEDVPQLHRGPIQLQGQMMIVGAKWGCVATLYQGTELRLFLFDQHHAAREKISEIAIDFEARLETYRQTGVVEAYPIDSPESGIAAYPAVKQEKMIQGTEEEDVLAGIIQESDRQIKAAEKAKGDAVAKLMNIIGDAEGIKTNRYTISWPMRHYKAQPEKTTPAKDAYSIRMKSLQVKEVTA